MQKAILAGIVGTVVMTAVIMVGPMMGMPEMPIPEMLAGMLGAPVAVGWVMHFMIGISLAIGYVQFFKVPIENLVLKGVIFGVIAFVFAQVGMMAMVKMGLVTPPPGSMAMMVMGRLIGHIIFGIAVALTVGKTSIENSTARAA